MNDIHVYRYRILHYSFAFLDKQSPFFLALIMNFTYMHLIRIYLQRVNYYLMLD